MNAHLIGRRLREQVLRDHQSRRPIDPRRLQSLIADLCGDEQQDLIAPLRYLLLSSAFASAAAMDPPLADGHHSRLSQELTEMFAPSVCRRMEPLLEGLLGLAATQAEANGTASAPWGTGNQAAPAAAGKAVPLPSAEPIPAAVPSRISSPEPRSTEPRHARNRSTAVNALLAFLSGVLLMALAGVGMLVWQRAAGVRGVDSSGASTEASPAPSSPVAPAAPPPDNAASETASETRTAPVLPTERAPVDSDQRSAEDRALGSLQQLFAALSSKDFNQAQQLYGPGAADQFGAAFYSQFERVSVQDLRVTSQTGSTLNLEGKVSFIWPDGSVQEETRTFSMDTSSEPPQITASEFGRVLSPRR